MFNRPQIIHNSNYKFEENFYLKTSNRAFLYGDSIFETMFASNGKVHFFNAHIQRLVSGMKALKYDIPEIFIYGKERLEKQIITLINKNKSFKGTRIRLMVYSNSKGKYTPSENTVDYIIETSPLNYFEYKLNTKGLVVDVFTEMQKSNSPFTRYKTGNSLLFTLAGKHAKLNNLDDTIILNSENNICETIASNIFIVSEKQIITPSLSSNCISGIMRANILNVSESLGYQPIISDNVTIKTLFTADEVFLTNAISGIKWILAFRGKRYLNKTSKQFLNEINSIL